MQYTEKDFKPGKNYAINFLWSYKRPRIVFITLRRPWSRRGINLPDRLYYEACQLTGIFPILQSLILNNWSNIEEYYAEGKPLADLFWNSPKDRPVFVQENPFLYNSLLIWDRPKPNLAPSPSILASFLNQPWFLPLNKVKLTVSWHNTKLEHLQDLFHKGKILEKQQLEKN